MGNTDDISYRSSQTTSKDGRKIHRDKTFMLMLLNLPAKHAGSPLLFQFVHMGRVEYWKARVQRGHETNSGGGLSGEVYLKA